MKVGDLIKELREAQGWSRPKLADELCRVSRHATVTSDEVKRWENGKVTPGPFWLRHLATALQVPAEVLDHVKRRRLLTDAAAVAIAPVVASDLLRYGFEHALVSRPSIDDWHAVLAGYGREYMSVGAAEIQRRLAGDLVVLQQGLDTPGMWNVASKLITLYAKTFPGSDGAKAVGWYRTAATAADRSEDRSARVWVRGRAAIALGYEGASLPLAERFADEAMALSDRPSLGRLNAVMGKAHVAALRGDRRTALHLLDTGRRVFDAAGSDEQESDYAVPEWRMNVFTSLLGARLGDETLALRAQSNARRTLPASLPRFATHLDLHSGLMLVRAGDRAGGIAHARTALDALPADKHSLTLRMLMAEIEAGPRPS